MRTRTPAARRRRADARASLLGLGLICSAGVACDPLLRAPRAEQPEMSPTSPARAPAPAPASDPASPPPVAPAEDPANTAPALAVDDAPDAEPAEAASSEPAPEFAPGSAPEAAPEEPGPARPELRPFTRWDAGSGLSAKERDRGAHARRQDTVRGLFTAAGLSFPPRQLLMRAFKAERELEVWATDRRGDPFTHVTTYKICAASGVAGPKKAEGDGQVPEGFYTINLFNPRSSYHLSMRVSYPNRRDRALRYTGSAIMIHGDCVSIGCLAMSDERIEELWVMNKALPEGERADVHLFPGRDLAGMIERARPRDPELAAFWTTLKRGNDAFEANHQLPVIRVKDGAYTVE